MIVATLRCDKCKKESELKLSNHPNWQKRMDEDVIDFAIHHTRIGDDFNHEIYGKHGLLLCNECGPKFLGKYENLLREFRVVV